MNNGLTSVPSGIIDALKSQPLSLALVIMNLGLLGYLYYEGAMVNAQRQGELKLLYDNRREVALLLARCHWPEGTPLPELKNNSLKIQE